VCRSPAQPAPVTTARSVSPMGAILAQTGGGQRQEPPSAPAAGEWRVLATRSGPRALTGSGPLRSPPVLGGVHLAYRRVA
jgi:hypothetical protein